MPLMSRLAALAPELVGAIRTNTVQFAPPATGAVQLFWVIPNSDTFAPLSATDGVPDVCRPLLVTVNWVDAVGVPAWVEPKSCAAGATLIEAAMNPVVVPLSVASSTGETENASDPLLAPSPAETGWKATVSEQPVLLGTMVFVHVSLLVWKSAAFVPPTTVPA